MQLDSVRELKAALTSSILVALAQSVTARRLLSVAAQPVSAATGMHRTIAVGIVKTGKKDYRLAVRLQRRAMESSPYLDAIHRKAKGEIDVQFVGRVVKRGLPWHRKRNRPLRIGGSIGHFAGLNEDVLDEGVKVATAVRSSWTTSAAASPYSLPGATRAGPTAGA